MAPTNLTKGERRALDYMLETTTALRKMAARNKFDMVHYFLDMTVIELNGILAGARPATPNHPTIDRQTHDLIVNLAAVLKPRFGHLRSKDEARGRDQAAT